MCVLEVYPAYFHGFPSKTMWCHRQEKSYERVKRWVRKGFPSCNEPSSNPAGHPHVPTHTLRGVCPQIPHTDAQSEERPASSGQCVTALRLLCAPGDNCQGLICKDSSSHHPRAAWWLFVPHEFAHPQWCFTHCLMGIFLFLCPERL